MSTWPAVLARVRNPVWTLAALWIVIEGLRQAKSILIPIAVAIMLAIICAPAVSWLERRRIPNAAAVMLVVLGIFGLLAILGAAVGGSVSSFRESIPRYEQRLAEMAQSSLAWLKGLGLPPEFDVGEIARFIEPGQAASRVLGIVPSAMGGLASALSNTFLVMFTMVFILMEKGTVAAKLRALAGAPDADISPYRRIATEVQSYLAIKTVVSVGTGIFIGVWCAALGVDFAVLWALVAFLLNYIPTIGSIIAAVPSVLLALVQHGPGTALALLAGYIVVNTLVGNVLEPMWMGRRLGLSTTVVFLSLVVWGWIWESVGMLLSVPLTMIIKIMLENSREYRFIAVLLDVGEEEARVPTAVDDARAAAAPRSPAGGRTTDASGSVRDPRPTRSSSTTTLPSETETPRVVDLPPPHGGEEAEDTGQHTTLLSAGEALSENPGGDLDDDRRSAPLPLVDDGEEDTQPDPGLAGAGPRGASRESARKSAE